MNAFTSIAALALTSIAAAQPQNLATENHDFVRSQYLSIGSPLTVGADATSTMTARYQTWTGGSTRYWRPFLRAEQTRRAWAEGFLWQPVGTPLGDEAVSVYGYSYTTSSSAYHGARVVIGGVVRESGFRSGTSRSFDTALHIAEAADFTSRYWVGGAPADLRHVFTGSAMLDMQSSRSGGGNDTELQLDFDGTTALSCTATLVFGSGISLISDLDPGMVRTQAQLRNDRGDLWDANYFIHDALQFHGDMTVDAGAANMNESLLRPVVTLDRFGRLTVRTESLRIVDSSRSRSMRLTGALFGWVSLSSYFGING